MKRPLTILASSILLAATAARADAIDCFPGCEPARAEERRVNLCEHQVVRDVARIDRELKPARELAGIVTNPTGFALKLVNDHVVHIPPWVGIAMDPRGYVRGKVIDRVRSEAKKAVGVGKDCEEEIAADAAAAV